MQVNTCDWQNEEKRRELIGMNEKKKVFEEYHPIKALMIMAVPAIIGQLITLIYNIADTWFIGLTNNPTMVAACSLVLPIYMLSVAVSNLFGTGGGSLISRLLGDKSELEAKKVFALSMWMSFVVAVIFSFSTMLAGYNLQLPIFLFR